MSAIELSPGRFLPLQEVDLAYARSGGPGGQNVNKVETRVIARLDIGASTTLTDAEKRRVSERLRTRIDKRGVLRVTSQKHRTQGLNRTAVIERLGELLREALAEKKRRRPSRVSASAREKRLDSKHRHGKIKRQREGRRRLAPESDD